MTPLRRLPWPELALLAMTVVWGMSFLTIKWALDAPCGVLTLNAVRNGIGLLFLLAVRPRAFAATPLEWKAGLLGGSILAGGYVLETAGMLEAGAGKSGFLAQFYVALVPFLQAAVFRRLPAWSDVGSLALATSGIAVMVVRPGVAISAGEVLVALAAVPWAVQIVLVGRVAQRIDPIRIAAIQVGVIAVVTGASLLFVHEPMPVWRPALVGHLVYLGVLASAAGFLVQAWAQRRVSPTRTAVLLCGQPVFAVLFAAWLTGEQFDLRDAAGAVLIMAAVVLTVVMQRNDAPDAAPAR